ncbi:MAG: Biotin transporter BioY2 [Chlamydiae bacterium]|nr:Biotin transporter BioY2 [Chlamydiota bacterium]
MYSIKSFSKKKWIARNPFLNVNSGVKHITTVILGSAIIATSAQVRIPIPWSPVPFTTQTLAIMMIGAFFGSRLGLQIVACYLFECACGLPVGSNYSGGIACLFGPTGGYLFGYLGQVYAVGVLCENGKHLRVSQKYLILSLISFLQLLLGSLWLSFYIPFSSCFKCGFYPFIPTALLKVSLVCSYLNFTYSNKGAQK